MIPSTAGWEPMSSLSQAGSTALQTSPNHGPDGFNRRMCQAHRASPQFQCWPVGQAPPVKNIKVVRSHRVLTGFTMDAAFPTDFKELPAVFLGRPRWVRTLNYEICVSQENICIYRKH